MKFGSGKFLMVGLGTGILAGILAGLVGIGGGVLPLSFGLIRGGHFVAGMTGEQFADETTVPLLRPRRAGRALARSSP